MSLNERSGKRDLLYSAWHRPASIKRFLGARRAAQLMVIDIDWCEACYACKRPLALIETQRSGNAPKAATVTVALAKLAGLPAFSVSYEESHEGGDIVRFRWKRLWPVGPALDQWFLPAEYAEWLWSLRRDHESDCQVLREAS